MVIVELSAPGNLSTLHGCHTSFSGLSSPASLGGFHSHWYLRGCVPVATVVNLTALPGTASFISCGCIVILGGLAVKQHVQKVDTGMLPSYSKYKNNMLQTLTNTKFSWIGSLATSTVPDDTAVAPFIGLLHTGNGYCRILCSWESPHITRLPLTIISGWLPLPVVTQRLCSSSLSSERHRFTWNNILQTLWMNGDSWRII